MENVSTRCIPCCKGSFQAIQENRGSLESPLSSVFHHRHLTNTPTARKHSDDADEILTSTSAPLVTVISDLVGQWVVVRSLGEQSIQQGSPVPPPLYRTGTAGWASCQSFLQVGARPGHRMCRGDSCEQWGHQISEEIESRLDLASSVLHLVFV